MTSKTLSVVNRPAAVVAIILLAIAVINCWDACHMKLRARYGVSASAASYFVAILFAAVAIGHLISAFRPRDVEAESTDWKAVSWIGLGLAGLIGSI
ncbi:hypothetical protein [Agrobacterium pusense]|uniref:hypothetical protein n=1 Tax=Agrobacterium pusense TaxID=648995 RepID=UPI001FCDD54B|nr:hypothetical protein [Agrobacterium pusense]